jgi:hypothetical protein
MPAFANERLVVPMHLGGSRGVHIEQAGDAVQEHGGSTFGKRGGVDLVAGASDADHYGGAQSAPIVHLY